MATGEPNAPTDSGGRAEERLRALADAMRAFAAATVDYDELVALIARRTAEIVGDYCSVVLLTEDGEHTQPAAYYHADPAVLAQIRGFLGDEPAKIAPITRRILSGPLILPEVDTEALGAFLRPEQRQVAERVGVRSLLSVPLRAHGRSIGMLSLLRLRGHLPPYDEGDLDLAQSLADHAALAIMNGRLLEASRRSEERYRRIVETTSEGIWMANAESKTTFMNVQLAAMLGVTPEAAHGRPTSDFFAAEDLAAHAAAFASRRQGIAGRRTLRLKRQDGSTLWASAQWNPIVDAEGRFEGVLGVLTDITDRRVAEALRARLAATAEVSHEAIASSTFDGRVTSWNRGAERLFGYRAEEMVGQSVLRLEPAERPSEIVALFERVRRGETIKTFDTVRRKKDGSLVEVSLTLYPIQDADGQSEASIIARDLTEQRRAEAALRVSEEQLRQSQKLEAVGSLAGGIAHDFNNLLSIILSFTSLVTDRLSPGDPIRFDLDEVRKAGERAADLTSKLLAFSRRQILQPRVVDLNHIVLGMERMVRRLLGEDVELSLHTATQIGSIYADSGALEQVILNLLVNARDAMPAGGKVSVETKNVVLDDRYAHDHVDVAAGRYVMLAVCDTGVGMDAATQARIFEPFFTTKEKGKGTGLGLSTVFGIVKQSGGHLWVYSEPGRGTAFKVYFPETDRAPPPEAAPVAPLRSRAGSESILLVEDDDQVRNAVRAILRASGYNVLEAQNGGEALLICEQFKARIDLLLTDVVMARMSGRQLAARLASERPAMKVLYVSGYTETSIVQHGVLDAGIAFLQKPITPDALLRKVREVLDGTT
jgi:two-component system cell cycle sensor histidine kinase/response regulator CckA